MSLDVGPRMIAWARRRARQAGVEDRIESSTGSVVDMPFEDDRFDVVFCESVLSFVDDRARASAECVRVTRPGGYVGLNESCWSMDPDSNLVTQMRLLGLDAEILSAADWQALFGAAGLQARVMRLRRVDAGREVRDRLRWIGLPWAVAGFARAARLYVTDPTTRQMLREHFTQPSIQLMSRLGYGLFVGRKGCPDRASPAGA